MDSCTVSDITQLRHSFISKSHFTTRSTLSTGTHSIYNDTRMSDCVLDFNYASLHYCDCSGSTFNGCRFNLNNGGPLYMSGANHVVDGCKIYGTSGPLIVLENADGALYDACSIELLGGFIASSTGCHFTNLDAPGCVISIGQNGTFVTSSYVNTVTISAPATTGGNIVNNNQFTVMPAEVYPSGNILR